MAPSSTPTDPVAPARFLGRIPPRVAGAAGLSLGTTLWVTFAFSHKGALPVVALLGPLVLVAVLHRPRWGILLLMVSLAIAPIFEHTGAMVENYVLPGLMLAGWALNLVWMRSTVRGLPRPLAIWFGLFLFWTVFTALLGEFPGLGIGVALRFGFLALVLLAIQNLQSTRDLGRALMAYAVALVPVAVYGLWKIWAGGLSGLYQQLAPGERLALFYGNPNTLGVIMGHGVAILFAYALLPSRKYRRALIAVPVVLSILGGLTLLGTVFASISRASILYAAAVLTLLISMRQRLRWVAAAVVAAVTAVFFIAPPIWLVSGLRLESGVSYRDVLWSAGWHILRDHPWTGVGSGSHVFEIYRPLYVQGAAERGLLVTQAGAAHNLYLSKGAEMGWPGLLLAVSLIVLLLFQIPRALDAYRRGSWIHGAAAAGIFGLALRAFFETGGTLSKGPAADSLMFFLFALILLRGDAENERPDPRAEGP